MMGDYHVRFCKRGRVGNNRIDSNFIVSMYCSRYKWLDCSSIKTIRELGLKRRESVLILSKFKFKLSSFYLVWEDR
jgi:hypothetical protein